MTAAPASPTAPTAAADADPAATLRRMAIALDSTEFEGTLVYLHGSHLSALRITRRITDGEARESLFALSGPVRAIARNGRGVTCVLPDARNIQVPRGGAGMTPASLDPARLGAHYQIEALGRSRVAGRDTDVVGIIPRDRLRYGYRYYIDRATGLPLKTDLMDNGATPIEQVMFTDIDVLPTADAPSVLHAGGSAAPEAPGAGPPPAAGRGAIAAPNWQLGRLPAGFEVIHHGHEPVAIGPADAGAATVAPATPNATPNANPNPDRDPDGDPETAGTAMEHFLVSDGLAGVSVTIAPVVDEGFTGVAQMGAAHAAGEVRDGWQITAIGEVPAPTVEAILGALRHHR